MGLRGHLTAVVVVGTCCLLSLFHFAPLHIHAHLPRLTTHASVLPLVKSVFDAQQEMQRFPILDRELDVLVKQGQTLTNITRDHKLTSDFTCPSYHFVVWNVAHGKESFCGSCSALSQTACVLKALGCNVSVFHQFGTQDGTSEGADVPLVCQDKLVEGITVPPLDLAAHLSELVDNPGRAVALYPDNVVDNPLRTRRFAFIVMFFPGSHGSPPTWPNGTALLCWHEEFCQTLPPTSLMFHNAQSHLNLPDFTPANWTSDTRLGSVYTIRKGHEVHKKPEEWYKTYHDRGEPEEGVVQTHVLKFSAPYKVCVLCAHKRVFYAYDPITFLNVIAAMCGCLSVQIPPPNSSNSVVFLGVAAGKADIPRALRTQKYVRKWLGLNQVVGVAQTMAFLQRTLHWEQWYVPDPFQPLRDQWQAVVGPSNAELRCYYRTRPLSERVQLGKNFTAVRQHFLTHVAKAAQSGAVSFCPDLTPEVIAKHMACFAKRYASPRRPTPFGHLINSDHNRTAVIFNSVGKWAGLNFFCPQEPIPDLEKTKAIRPTPTDEELLWCYAERLAFMYKHPAFSGGAHWGRQPLITDEFDPAALRKRYFGPAGWPKGHHNPYCAQEVVESTMHTEPVIPTKSPNGTDSIVF